MAASDTRKINGKRVVLVSEMLRIGGLQNQAMLLGKYLHECGAIVKILGYGEPEKELIRRLAAHNIPWRSIPYPWEDGYIQTAKSLGRFAKILRSEQPDIIIPFSGPSNLACNLVWRATGAKICVWNQRNAGREPLSPILLRLACKLTSGSTSNNQLGSNYLQRHGMPSAKITYIPDGIESLPSAPKKASGLPPADFTAAMVANMMEPKDHQTLLRAWKVVMKTLESQHKAANLFLIGRKGETYAQVQQTITALGLKDSVHLLGIRDDIPQILASIDLYIHSSRSEGCPNAILEAMRAALPITGTDIPNISNILTKDNRPFLAPVGDHKTLAANIVALYENEELRQRFGQANRGKFESTYTIESAGQQYLTMLESLMPE